MFKGWLWGEEGEMGNGSQEREPCLFVDNGSTFEKKKKCYRIVVNLNTPGQAVH